MYIYLRLASLGRDELLEDSVALVARLEGAGVLLFVVWFRFESLGIKRCLFSSMIDMNGK